MPTTQDVIRRWLDEGAKANCGHMIVATDTFDWSDYPVFVARHEDVRKRVAEVAAESMQKVTEVYSLLKDLEPQIAERRAYHLD